MGKKEFLKTMIDGVTSIIVGNKEVLEANVALITNLVNEMSPNEMDAFVAKLSSGEVVIPIIIPNGSKAINYDNNLKLFDKLGESLHERIIITENGVDTMSPIKRLIVELPGKKPIQLLDKKRSIPDDQNSTNMITGQVTGASKGASITNPEISQMMANGMFDSIRELTKYRGGDTNAGIVADKLAMNGRVIEQDILEKYSSGPEVNNAIHQYLLSMHIDNNANQSNK